MYTITSCAKNIFTYSFPKFTLFISFSCLVALARLTVQFELKK